MTSRLRLAAMSALAFLANACAPSDSIDQSGEVFAGISAAETVRLTGNEPFWGMEILAETDGEHTARYSTPDNIEGTAFKVVRFAGNNGVGFSGELDGDAVQIAITPGDCGDGMSDRTYPFAATVALGDATLFGCAYTDSQPFTGPASP